MNKKNILAIRINNINTNAKQYSQIGGFINDRIWLIAKLLKISTIHNTSKINIDDS